MSRSRRDRPRTRPADADYLRALVERGSEPGFWDSVRDEELAPAAYQLALYFGLQRDAETAASLSSLYARLVARVTAADRMELLDRLAESVRGGASSALALLPFLQHELDARVAQAAALAFASLLPAGEDDPLAGPRAVRALLDHADEEAVREGIVAALVALGDRRALPLVLGSWRALAATSRARLLATPPPFASVLAVEFLLDWLEDADDAEAAAVAGALARLPGAGGGRVLDLERRLPEREGEELDVVGEWTAAEFGARLAPKLDDLARRLRDPRLLDAVRRAWGLARAS